MTYSIDVRRGSPEIQEAKENTTITYGWLTFLGGIAVTTLNVATQATEFVSGIITDAMSNSSSFTDEAKTGVTLTGLSMISGGAVAVGRTIRRQRNRLKNITN